MNRSTKSPPRLPTRPIRLKDSSYRRRWKPVGRETRLPDINSVEPTAPPAPKA